MRQRDKRTTRSSMRAARRDPTKNVPPHVARALRAELEEVLFPERAEVEAPWKCPLGVARCGDERAHRAHEDPISLLKGTKPLRREVLEALVGRPSEEAFDLLLQRSDVGGLHRESLISRAITAPYWNMVLLHARSLSELRILAKLKAPTEEACRDLMQALDGDVRGCVQQLFRERNARFLALHYGSRGPDSDFLHVVVEEGGEFARMADALLNLPCPSGTWTEPLVVGTVKKLLSRLPSGAEREACAEIIVGLAVNWEGTVAELVEASELLTF